MGVVQCGLRGDRRGRVSRTRCGPQPSLSRVGGVSPAGRSRSRLGGSSMLQNRAKRDSLLHVGHADVRKPILRPRTEEGPIIAARHLAPMPHSDVPTRFPASPSSVHTSNVVVLGIPYEARLMGDCHTLCQPGSRPDWRLDMPRSAGCQICRRGRCVTHACESIELWKDRGHRGNPGSNRRLVGFHLP